MKAIHDDLDYLGYVGWHTHKSEVRIDPIGLRGQQVITNCVALQKTSRRLSKMEGTLSLMAKSLGMDVAMHFYASGKKLHMGKSGKDLMYGAISSIELVWPSVLTLELQGMQVLAPQGFDRYQTFPLERTNVVVLVPCKHLLSHCSHEISATLRVGPHNWSFIDWLNLQIIR